jgi:uncharacterized protein (TIGR00730 family)
MSKGTHQKRSFSSAQEAAESARLHIDLPQCRSTSYQLAFQDPEFLLRDALRPVRLQLELLKPELILKEQHIESTIVIFGSARILDPEGAESQLVSISSNTGKDKLVVITGGGPGIMEAANRGAHEAGMPSIGMNIVLPHEQAPNPYITPDLNFQFHYFAVRKMHLLMRAKSLVAFPGGFGTLDELFETLTLIQTHKVLPIPVLLFGKTFWDRVINFNALVEEGTISAEDLELFSYVETAEEAWEKISAANIL